MPRQQSWSDLRGGIIALGAIVVLVLATLLFARVGALHGRKVTLYVLADEATGVLRGTEVWLAGKHAGTVKNVEFRPPTSDTSNRILITTEFLARHLEHVRRDSWAQIQAGGKLLGTPVVYVSIGSNTLPGLGDKDTIRARPKPRALDVAGQVTALAPEVRGLMTEVTQLTTKMSRPVGTIGNFRTQGMPEMPAAFERMSRIGNKTTSGSGTIGLALRGGLKDRAVRVMSDADALMALASSDKGTVGRFRRDSTLMTKAKGIMAEIDSLRARAKGFGGPDTTLALALTQRRALMDSLVKDIKANPLRYIAF